MTIKEKIRNVFKKHFTIGKEEDLLLSFVDDEIEKITYDFALDFAKWYQFRFTDANDLTTDDEMLDIYKKTKGL